MVKNAHFIFIYILGFICDAKKGNGFEGNASDCSKQPNFK